MGAARARGALTGPATAPGPSVPITESLRSIGPVDWQLFHWLNDLLVGHGLIADQIEDFSL